MAAQRHVIKRQTVELTVGRREDAWPLQQACSRILRQRLAPLLDRRCSEASSADRLHRIERLELDLGRIDPEQLETQLLERIDTALRRALAEEIGHLDSAAATQEPAPFQASQWELLSRFLREGALPWWADTSRNDLPQQALDALLQDAPDLLRRRLPALLEHDNAVQRLIHRFDDRQLAAVATLPAGLPGGTLAPLYHALRNAAAGLPQLRHTAPTALRREVWQAILDTAFTVEPPAAELLETAARRFAARHNLSPQALRQELNPIAQRSAAADLPPHRATAARSELTPPAAPSGGETHESSAASPAEQPAEAIAQGDETASQAAMEPSFTTVQQTPPVTRSSGGTPSDAIPAAQRPDAHALSPLRQSPRPDTLAGIGGAGQETATAAAVDEPLQAAAAPANRPAAADAPAAAPRAHRRGMAPAVIGPDAPLDANDEFYVGNAGLPILWPFLGHFFRQLGLAEEGRFRSPAAAQRAVGLLQYLIDGEPEPAEYLLPLNKVLCGLRPAQLFAPDSPPTAVEMAECQALLGAAIANAPILKQMSIAGFRGSFLLRRGILSVRDGGWLLQVERETYDIVLERFPWSFDWIKLPWMEAPLRVEW
ncbi:contractile injection system tape measure protein [Methylogaea oryzae]|uniref:Uncharacterized protein n=1 Tax=Methylogaea oryzae TaxID=1295382 RepID=A0A8D4VN81_9GAMM|nr:contractile injection system tape measure protein [Methylogaea oryzae]BBL70701.1 hypothetical protein MoryE10_13070 [Methylogaea oryzae]